MCQNLPGQWLVLMFASERELYFLDTYSIKPKCVWMFQALSWPWLMLMVVSERGL